MNFKFIMNSDIAICLPIKILPQYPNSIVIVSVHVEQLHPNKRCFWYGHNGYSNSLETFGQVQGEII